MIHLGPIRARYAYRWQAVQPNPTFIGLFEWIDAHSLLLSDSKSRFVFFCAPLGLASIFSCCDQSCTPLTVHFTIRKLNSAENRK